MNYFMQAGDDFMLAPSRDALLETLPKGFYTVEVNPLSGQAYFHRTSAFGSASKIYGDLSARAERIVKTALDRAQNTGVLLAGEKGSGKSLLAKLISERALAVNMPVIMVRTPIEGDVLAPLLSSLTEPAVVFIDEFEKIYEDRSVQASLLSLLDGTTSSKILYLLTANDDATLSAFLSNRPGRIFYRLVFSGLEESFIREYCEDRLENMEEVGAIVRLSGLFAAFNFDMLKALVEEMNRYGESAVEAAKWLNMTPSGDNSTYSMKISKDGVEYNPFYATYHGSPLMMVNYSISVEDPEDSLEEIRLPLFSTDQLVHVNSDKGIYTFKRDGWTVIFERDGLNSAHWTSWGAY